MDGIVCNAGWQNVGAPTKTAEGYETTFAVNHLGHYLLSRLLLPDLAEGARITFVSSGTHDPLAKTGMPEPQYNSADAWAHDFEPGMRAGQRRYTTSKLCNIYTTYELARRLAVSPHPRLQSLRSRCDRPRADAGYRLGADLFGAAALRVQRRFCPLLSLVVPNVHKSATSGRRLAALASGSEGQTTGKYFSDGREDWSSVASYDLGNALDLWAASARMTGLASEL